MSILVRLGSAAWRSPVAGGIARIRVAASKLAATAIFSILVGACTQVSLEHPVSLPAAAPASSSSMSTNEKPESEVPSGGLVQMAPVDSDAGFDRACAARRDDRSAFLLHDSRLCISGRLTHALERVAGRMIEEGARDGSLKAIVLNSGGGIRIASHGLARSIAASGLPVYVPARHICQSGCVLLLAAAREAHVDARARVSVHYAFVDHGDTITVKKGGSTAYFDAIDPTGGLFRDYQRIMVNRGMVSPADIEGDFSRSKHLGSASWTNAAFWDLDGAELRRYGIVGG